MKVGSKHKCPVCGSNLVTVGEIDSMIATNSPFRKVKIQVFCSSNRCDFEGEFIIKTKESIEIVKTKLDGEKEEAND